MRLANRILDAVLPIDSFPLLTRLCTFVQYDIDCLQDELKEGKTPFYMVVRLQDLLILAVRVNNMMRPTSKRNLYAELVPLSTRDRAYAADAIYAELTTSTQFITRSLEVGANLLSYIKGYAGAGTLAKHVIARHVIVESDLRLIRSICGLLELMRQDVRQKGVRHSTAEAVEEAARHREYVTIVLACLNMVAPASKRLVEAAVAGDSLPSIVLQVFPDVLDPALVAGK